MIYEITLAVCGGVSIKNNGRSKTAEKTHEKRQNRQNTEKFGGTPGRLAHQMPDRFERLLRDAVNR